MVSLPSFSVVFSLFPLAARHKTMTPLELVIGSAVRIRPICCKWPLVFQFCSTVACPKSDCLSRWKGLPVNITV